MTKVTVSLPLNKDEFIKKLQTACSQERNKEATELLGAAFANWMLPSDKNPIFTLDELLKFPRKLFMTAVVTQMCDRGLYRSFPKFWEMVEQYQGETWIYETVMLVYDGLPYVANPQQVRAEIQSSLGYVPEELAADNRAKCWSYLDSNPLPAEDIRKLRRRYHNLLHSNKNKELLSLLHVAECTCHS
jgi:hypothetical protein